MILRLRVQFVALSMSMVTVVMLGVFCFFHLSTQASLESASQLVLERVLRQSSSSVSLMGDVQLPYFAVSLFPNSTGYSAYITGGTYEDLDNSQVLSDILEACLLQGQDSGVIEEYNLRYLRQNTGFVEQIAFVDTSVEQATIQTMLANYVKGGLVAFWGLLALTCWLSGWVVRPVERAWQGQRQFLADASHELKTPLTVILSNAQLLDTIDLPPQGERWVDNIHYESQQMKTLVEQMLTLARTDQMTPTATLSQVSLWDVVTDCVLLFEPVAFEAGKPIEESIAPEVMVLGDSTKLRQLVSILLDNAIKYGAQNAPIGVTLQKTEKIAKLTVENQGTPIPPQQLKRIFERFYRVDQSRGEQTGFGLGLSIATTIAKEHKATLKAESDTRSTRFILTVPLKKG